MRRLIHRFSLSHVLGFVFPVTIGFLILSLTACGGSGGSSAPKSTVVAISITPGNTLVSISGTATFTATVTGATDTSVTWAVVETSGGAIDSNGKYAAPNLAGTYHVAARSNADLTKSATASVVVSAPAPVFTSSKPALNSGSEGTPFVYKAVATDPAGGTVTYKLSAAPTGGALVGDTVTWTPTHVLARADSAFAIIALTSEGGSSELDFTISPAGNINGMRAFTYHTVDTTGTFATASIPDDTTQFPINALVPNGNGGFTTFVGTGSTNGTYSVPSVPAGYYWLQHGAYNYFWSKSSNIDSGYDLNNRQGLTSAGPGTTLNLSMSNANAVQSADQFTFFSPATDDFIPYSGTLGTTQLSVSTSLYPTYDLLNANQGDYAYVYQLVHNYGGANGGWVSLQRIYGPQLFTTLSGTANPLNGSFVPVAVTSSVRGSIKGSQFAAFTAHMGPNATDLNTCGGLDVLHEPANVGQTSSTADLVLTDDCSGIGLGLTDVDLGDIPYGNPFPPNWPLFAFFQHTVGVSYTLPGSANPLKMNLYNWVATTSLPTAGIPLAPIVGPVVNPTISAWGGSTAINLLSGASNVGTSPVLGWQPPALGTPTGYRIAIYSVNTASFVYLNVGSSVTSVQIPPGLLQTGLKYVIEVLSFAETGVNNETSPYRKSLPEGSSTVASGLITP